MFVLFLFANFLLRTFASICINIVQIFFPALSSRFDIGPRLKTIGISCVSYNDSLD